VDTSPELLQAALDAIEEHVFVLDRAGRNVYANLAGAHAFGRGRSEIVGLSWREIIKQTDRVEGFERLLEEVFQTAREREGVYTVGGIAGLRDHAFILKPLLGPDGHSVEKVLAIAKDVTGTTAAARPDQRLTSREREVVELLVRGHANKEIARRLHISTRTVESHRRNVGKKLDMTTRAEIFAYANDHGWV
jgi:PAS domain S-box-containing protein